MNKNGYNNRIEFLDAIDFLDDFITKTREQGDSVSVHGDYLWNELEKMGLSEQERVNAIRQCYMMRDNK